MHSECAFRLRERRDVFERMNLSTCDGEFVQQENVLSCKCRVNDPNRLAETRWVEVYEDEASFFEGGMITPDILCNLLDIFSNTLVDLISFLRKTCTILNVFNHKLVKSSTYDGPRSSLCTSEC